VTGLHDANAIKESILKKMGLKGDPDRYLYFHENGQEPGQYSNHVRVYSYYTQRLINAPLQDVPLQAQNLVHLCRMADYSAANRILVKPIKQSTFAYFQEQVWNNIVGSGGDQKYPTISSPQLQEGSDYLPTAQRTGYEIYHVPHNFSTPNLGDSPSARRNMKVKDNSQSPTHPR
jgi:hypothetical protein